MEVSILLHVEILSGISRHHSSGGSDSVPAPSAERYVLRLRQRHSYLSFRNRSDLDELLLCGDCPDTEEEFDIEAEFPEIFVKAKSTGTQCGSSFWSVQPERPAPVKRERPQSDGTTRPRHRNPCKMLQSVAISHSCIYACAPIYR